MGSHIYNQDKPQRKPRRYPIRALEFALGLGLACIGVFGLCYYDSLPYIIPAILGIVGMVDSMVN